MCYNHNRNDRKLLTKRRKKIKKHVLYMPEEMSNIGTKKVYKISYKHKNNRKFAAKHMKTHKNLLQTQ